MTIYDLQIWIQSSIQWIDYQSQHNRISWSAVCEIEIHATDVLSFNEINTILTVISLKIFKQKRQKKKTNKSHEDDKINMRVILTGWLEKSKATDEADKMILIARTTKYVYNRERNFIC